MRYLATILVGLIVVAPAWANRLDTVLRQAEALGAPLRATFERRKTGLDPDGLKVLLAELSGDVTKQTQWRAFLGKNRLTAPDDFALVNDAIREFVLSPAGAPIAESHVSSSWPPSGPWQNRDKTPGVEVTWVAFERKADSPSC